MRGIDIYNMKSKTMFFNGAAQGVRFISTLAFSSSKVLNRLNPALLCIDAVISVGDAIVSCNNYYRSKEITKQLEAELGVIKREYSNLKIRLHAEKDKFTYKLDKEVEKINKKLVNNREYYDIYRSLYKQSKKYLKTIKCLLEEVKKDYPDSEKVKDLEQKYYEALRAFIKAANEIIGGV